MKRLALVLFVANLAMAGDRAGNGTDPIEHLFERARMVAADAVRTVDADKIDDEAARKWVSELAASGQLNALASDILGSPHDWDSRREATDGTCALTQPEPGAPIQFAERKCRESLSVMGKQTVSFDEVFNLFVQSSNRPGDALKMMLDREMEFVVTTLVHESVHHLRNPGRKWNDSENQFEEQLARSVASGVYVQSVSRPNSLATVLRAAPAPYLVEGQYISLNQILEEPIELDRHEGFNIFTFRDLNRPGTRGLKVPQLELTFDPSTGRHTGTKKITDGDLCYWYYQVEIVFDRDRYYFREKFPTHAYGQPGQPCITEGYQWNFHPYPYVLTAGYYANAYYEAAKHETDPKQKETLNFFYAVARGDKETVDAMLPTADFNSRDWQGRTPLMAALAPKNSAMFELLLPHSDLSAVDSLKRDVMDHATALKSPEDKEYFVLRLLKARPGHTPWVDRALTWIVYEQSVDLLKQILALSPSPVAILAAVAHARYGIKNDAPHKVQFMRLLATAPTADKSSLHETLSWAVGRRNEAFVDELLTYEPTPEGVGESLAIMKLNSDAGPGLSQLEDRIFLKLLNFGVPQDARERALRFVIVANKSKLVEALFAKGVDPNRRYSDGLTPLAYAIGGIRPKMLDLLLKKGADVNARFVNGIETNSFGYCVHYKTNIEILKKLIAAKAELNVIDLEGYSPLDRVIQSLEMFLLAPPLQKLREKDYRYNVQLYRWLRHQGCREYKLKPPVLPKS